MFLFTFARIEAHFSSVFFCVLKKNLDSNKLFYYYSFERDLALTELTPPLPAIAGTGLGLGRGVGQSTMCSRRNPVLRGCRRVLLLREAALEHRAGIGKGARMGAGTLIRDVTS